MAQALREHFAFCWQDQPPSGTNPSLPGSRQGSRQGRSVRTFSLHDDRPSSDLTLSRPCSRNSPLGSRQGSRQGRVRWNSDSRCCSRESDYLDSGDLFPSRRNTKETTLYTLPFLSEAANTCACGNIFMPDAVFCRICGETRPKADGKKLKKGMPGVSNLVDGARRKDASVARPSTQSLPSMRSSRPVVPLDPTPQQFGCGDCGHAASLVARGRQKMLAQKILLENGSLEAARHNLHGKHLTIPEIRTMPRGVRTPVMHRDNSSLFNAQAYATAHPRRKAAMSDGLTARTLTKCIQGLKRVNSEVTTEAMTQRLLSDGWLAVEVQDMMAAGLQQLRKMQESRQANQPERASFTNDFLGAKVAPPLPCQVTPVLLASELPSYLKEKLRMLPVTVVNSSGALPQTFYDIAAERTVRQAGGCSEPLHDEGCIVSMRFGDVASAQAAATYLLTKIKAVEEFGHYRAIREGPFVKLNIGVCRDQEEVDKLIQTLKEVHMFRLPRRR